MDIEKKKQEDCPRLESVQISLTNRCNLKCKHCAASANSINGNDPLTTAEFKTIIDKLLSCKVEKIILSGGEPLVRNDLIEILHYIREKGRRSLYPEPLWGVY